MGGILEARLRCRAEPISSLTNPFATTFFAVAVTEDFKIGCFTGEQELDVLERTLDSKDNGCLCNGRRMPCRLCQMSAAVVRAAAFCIGNVAEELISHREAGTGEIEIKSEVRDREPISNLTNHLSAMFLVVTVTEEFEVRCFTGEQAPNLIKRTLAPGEIHLSHSDGFAIPSVWCSVTAAIGEAVTSHLADIAQKLPGRGARGAE